MKRAELVFIPAPAVGHLVSILKFATQFLARAHGFSITILLANSTPVNQTFNSERIRYVRLPPVDRPPPELFSTSMAEYLSIWLGNHKPLIRQAIIDHVLSATDASPLAGLVLDLLFSSIIDVGKQLGVPSYIFYTSGAAFYGFNRYLDTRHQRVGVQLTESDNELIIPSFVHPVPSWVIPSFAFHKGGYSTIVTHAQKVMEAKGIIINTFAELEPHAVSSIAGAGSPPIYTVGPVLDLKGEHRPPSDENLRREIMKWLDEQPPLSVVLLCFGSWGSFRPPQVREIAEGLEKSGKRFIWSLRRAADGDTVELSSDYEDYGEVLPEGFLERIEGKGMICRWVPQVDILAHEAIGGFVSHCGWNSILESIWYGVPLVAWPLYAEQRMNAFELVRELGMAVELKIDYREDSGEVVGAEEIERAVRCVMENDSELRKKIKHISEESRRAMCDGGSSYVSLGKLIDDMSENIS